MRSAPVTFFTPLLCVMLVALSACHGGPEGDLLGVGTSGPKADDPVAGASGNAVALVRHPTDPDVTRIVIRGPVASDILPRMFSGGVAEYGTANGVVVGFFQSPPVVGCSMSQDSERFCVIDAPTDAVVNRAQDLTDGRWVSFGGGSASAFRSGMNPGWLEEGGMHPFACDASTCSLRKETLTVRERSTEAKEIIAALRGAPREVLWRDAGLDVWSLDALEAFRAKHTIGSLAQAAAIGSFGPAGLLRVIRFVRQQRYQRSNPHEGAFYGEFDARASHLPGGIASVIARIREDRAATATEWRTELSPLVDDAPYHACALGRALVWMLADAELAFEPAAQAAVEEVLRGRMGYPIARGERPDLAKAERIISANLTEPDRALHLTWRARSGDRVAIAVIDSGFELGHPGLVARWAFNEVERPGSVDHDGNALAGDFVGGDLVDADGDLPHADLHGLAVSGIAAAGTNALQILALNFNTSSFASAEDHARLVVALDLALSRGVSIINLSQIVPDDHAKPVLDRMAAHPGVLFVVAAGNGGHEFAPGRNVSYAVASARLDNVIVVAGSDDDGRRWAYSDYHPSLVDVAAPAYAAAPNLGAEYFLRSSGTSWSAPRVANLAAKLRLVHPKITASEIKRLLIVTTDRDPHWAPFVVAKGVVNLLRALRAADVLRLMADGFDVEAALVRQLLPPDQTVQVRTDVLSFLGSPG